MKHLACAADARARKDIGLTNSSFFLYFFQLTRRLLETNKQHCGKKDQKKHRDSSYIPQ